MDQSISEQLEETFQRASATFVRNLLKTGRDRAEFDAIMDEAVDRQQELDRLYQQDYTNRVEAERQRLYDEAAQHKLDYPAPPGVTTNSDSAITRRAREIVELAHLADMARARSDAQRAHEDLLARIQRRDQVKDFAVDAYLRASNRRSSEQRRVGEDRRVLKQSQD